MGGYSAGLATMTNSLGEEVVVIGHANPIFAQEAYSITTANFEEIFSYTSVASTTRILTINCTASTPSVFQVMINGAQIQEKWSSPTERNVIFTFSEFRPLLFGEILSVEAKVERYIWPSYSSFTSMDGYK